MAAPSSILIVDDDREIRTLLGEYLESNGYKCQAVADGSGMRAALGVGAFDLVVLDLMLPGDDGLVLCAELRATSPIAIIMLTARDEPVDRIVGLEMGADDYLAKPFEPRELLARIRSVLRRSQEPHVDRVARVRFGSWILDVRARHLVDERGVVVALSGAEFRLLTAFLKHPNHVLSRDRLLDLTQGRDAESYERSIDLQVSRLRQRLRDDMRSSPLIKTVRGEGYVFAATASAEA